MIRPLLFALLVTLAPLAAGCGIYGVRVEPVAVSVQKPANVALYVSVKDGDRPVPGLTEQSFSVFEDEQPVAPSDAKLVLLDREVAVAHQVLVLVDVSTQLDQAARADLAKGVKNFVEKVRPKQGVTVFAYDGSATLYEIADYLRGTTEEPAEIGKLVDLQPKDPSRNLYGAILEGVKELEARLMREKKPVRVGTLVVFARGRDMAGRATEEQVTTELERKGFDAFAIGIGEPAENWLNNIGHSGVVSAQAANTVPIAFEEAGMKVDDALDRFYLVSYCSPSRAGTRRLRLEVTFRNAQGEERKGSLRHEFDATGFEPGCDPKAVPRFVVGGAVEAAAPAPTAPTPGAPASDEHGANPTEVAPIKEGQSAKPAEAAPTQPSK